MLMFFRFKRSRKRHCSDHFIGSKRMADNLFYFVPGKEVVSFINSQPITDDNLSLLKFAYPGIKISQILKT
jgi:hypothetical protein